MRELKAARHFIFMEYFIVERGIHVGQYPEGAGGEGKGEAWRSGSCMTACAALCFFRTIIPGCWRKRESAAKCFRL